MQKTNIDNAIAITREIYWVGFFEETTKLQCNPYLLIDEKDVVLFDPGSIPDFPKVMRKVVDLINPHEINWIVALHQDPDVCGNLAVVEDVIDNPELRIAAHINTVRLIQHLGPRSPFYPVDQHDYRITLKSGRELQFIYMPYLHSPGALAAYDPKSRALFSSDLFGAIAKSQDLFSTEGFPQNMDAFHQAYMPSNQVLRHGLERLKGLDIQMILPQHGSIIEGRNVQLAIDHLMELPCGIDLM